MGPRIKILLLSRSRLFRETLGRMLRQESYIVVPAPCDGSLDVRTLVKDEHIDVILTEAPVVSGATLDLLGEICHSNSKVRVVMVGTQDDQPAFLTVAQAGLAGALLKDASAAEVLAAIRAVAGGRQ